VSVTKHGFDRQVCVNISKNVNETCSAWAELIEVGEQEDGRTDEHTDMTEFIMGFAILRKRPKGLLITLNKPKTLKLIR